uniref:Protein CSN12 homolog n=1 Tax=Fusarium oxysporum (strain Fo5176) TaxID=660025 RepID=A0A0D2Y4J1_FUSOF
MNTLFDQFAEAHSQKNGYKLAQTLSPVAPPDDPHRLMAVWRSTNSHSVKGDIKHFIKSSTSHRRKMSHDETTGWVEVYTSYWKAIAEILAGESGKSTWTKVYEAWKELTSVLIRGYNSHGFEAWTIPSLYMVGKYLRLFAIKSDEERQAKTFDTGPGASLISDDFDPETDKQLQAPLEESRKWGIYFVINLLFKTYFKLNSASLSRTILKTLAVYNDKGDMPPLEMFPKSQRVTFKFYEGVLLFLEENYNKRGNYATKTLSVNPTTNIRRQNTIRTRIKSGNLQAFDKALQDGEAEFVKRRIYLTLERGRDIALRNLLRKVFIAGGFDEPKEGETTPVRRTRIPVAEFQAAVSMGSGHMVDPDEVECMLANMIYKELMKGYIARERGIVVLSKKGAFPGTGL